MKTWRTVLMFIAAACVSHGITFSFTDVQFPSSQGLPPRSGTVEVTLGSSAGDMVWSGGGDGVYLVGGPWSGQVYVWSGGPYHSMNLGASSQTFTIYATLGNGSQLLGQVHWDGTTGAISDPNAGPSPIRPRKLTWTVINSNAGEPDPSKLQTWAIFQYKDGVATGIAFGSRTLEAGESVTFDFVIMEGDTYSYAPARVDYAQSVSTYGGFPTSGTAYDLKPDGTTDPTKPLFTYLEGVVPEPGSAGTMGNYSSATTITSLPTGGFGPGMSYRVPVISAPTPVGGGVTVTPGVGGGTGATDDGTASAVQQGANGIITAVNTNGASARTAINGTTAAVQSSGSALVAAINGLGLAIDARLAALETKEQRDAKISAGEVAAMTLGSSEAAAMDGKVQASMAAAAGVASDLSVTGMLASAKTVTATTPFPDDNGYANQAHVVAASGLLSEGIDTNPFTSAHVAELVGGGTLSAWAAWVRNAIGWVIVVGFLTYTANEVKKACAIMGSTQPMRLSAGTEIVLHTSVVGNSVGVPAAGIMWSVGVVVISTLILAAPVIIVAAFSTASGAEGMIAAAITHATGGANPGINVANALSYTNRFIPLVLVGTAVANGLLVQIAAITQWVIYTVGIKLIPI